MDKAEFKARKFKLQNIIAERALRRGRKLNIHEKIANLEDGLDLPRGYILDLFRKQKETK